MKKFIFCAVGRPNFKIDMNQVTNLKSLDFTWKKNSKFTGNFEKFLIPTFLKPFILW